MARIDRMTASDVLSRAKAPRGTDFHALPSSVVEALIEEADAHGYRRPRNANGSRARYFHAYLTRAAGRRE
jgi:hypothetical protein